MKRFLDSPRRGERLVPMFGPQSKYWLRTVKLDKLDLILGAFVLLLFILAMTGCAKREPAPAPAQPAPVAQAAPAPAPAKSERSHECGAMTKSGKPCTRRVSNDHGKDALCFQHATK